MRTIDAVRRPGISIHADRTVRDAAVLMERSGVGSLAVLDDDRLVGLVTDRDLVRRALAPGLDPEARIDGVMTMPVETIDAGLDVRDAIRAFREQDARRLAVLEDGRFVGILSVDDLVLGLVADLHDLTHPIESELAHPQQDAPLPARPLGAST